MKVLLLSQFYPPVIGGEERHVRNLALELLGRGHDVTVATLALPGTQAGSSVEDGINVHRLRSATSKLSALYSDDARPHLPPIPDPVLTRQLAVLTDELDPDVVHAHNWICNSYVPLARHRRAGLVLTLHDYSDRCATKRYIHEGATCTGPELRKCLSCAAEHYGPLKGAVTVLALKAFAPVRHRSVDRVLTVSQAVATGNGLTEAGVPYTVVPNFVSDALLEPQPKRPRPSFAPAEPYVLFVGDLTAEKGLHALVEAHGLLDAPPPLLLAGRRGPDTPTELPEGVTLVEDLQHEDVLAAFDHALLAALPSVWPDPCPTTVLEAMALGVPVITTNTGGMVDMVEHDVSGLLVPPGDALALSAALAQLIKDEVARDDYSRAGRERVRSRFSVRSVADTLTDLYEDVTG